MKCFNSRTCLWFIAGWLSLCFASAGEIERTTAGTNSPAQALLEKYRFALCQLGPEGLVDLEKKDLRLAWVRREAPVSPLPEGDPLKAMGYTFRGQHRTLEDYLNRNNVLGFLVLRDGGVALEVYRHQAQPSTRFLSNSMAKSIVSILIGIAIAEGKIADVNDPVVHYLPELAGGAFKDVSIKCLLQMAAGIRWNEDYLHPETDFARFVQAWMEGSPSYEELMAGCEAEEPSCARMEYQSIITQVLGHLLEAATGLPLNEYCEQALWRKLGAESDAFFYGGTNQTRISAAVGFGATLRDYARFGLMVMNGGRMNSRQLVPEDWIRESTTPLGASELPKPVGPEQDYAEQLGYAYQWWLVDGGIAAAMGIYGQAIYVNPARRTVIVQLSAWSEPDPDDGWSEMLAVMNAIAESRQPARITDGWWAENATFYEKIRRHPFNQELLGGRLDENVFKTYLLQDYLYLQNYRKVYGLLLARAPDEASAAFLVKLINAIDEELATVHQHMGPRFGLTPEDFAAASPAPPCELYCDFLIKSAVTEPFEAGLAAMLPCTWVYFQLAADMGRHEIAPGNKYRDWISGYSESWEESEAKQYVDFVESRLQEASPAVRESARRAFWKAMRLEYLFWDGAYRATQWPE